MHKAFTLLTAIAGIAIATPSFADNDVKDDKQDIQGDINAINKDDVALQQHRETLRNDRAAKAADKANGDTAKQAADSVRIGADLTAIAEKKAERKVYREKLEHDEKELNEDRVEAANDQ